MPQILSITIDGQAFTIPTGKTYNYQDSGHGMNDNNAATVSEILNDSGDGDGRVSGNGMCDPLPNRAKNHQDCYHTHESGRGGDQVFFNWAWTPAPTSALAITTKALKHA